MKKFVAGAIFGAALMLTTSVFADGALKQITAYLTPDVSVEIDGKKVALENIPVNYDGSTYLPVRELASAVGLAVDWDDASRTAKLSSGSAEVEPVVINGISAIQINGDTYLDLRELILNNLYPRYDFYFDEQSKSLYLVDKSGNDSSRTTLLSGIPYEVRNGATFIEENYYQEKIVPLIKN